jgi:GrpB-like predicted nucleotidyltransferase (UPF0157 family)
VIEVVEYDEAWPVRAAAARAELMPLGVFDAVEHIGSTSVPGLAAKPIIDLMAAAELKQRLAAEDTDGDAYTKAKTELIQELTDRARADRGLPPVPVWEE